MNQTGWKNDPLSKTYWRYVDDGVASTAGILHPEVDRLTGRQLQFENVILLFAKHDVISPTNLDIRLDRGRTGKAMVFRNGQMYSIQWSTEQEGPIPIRKWRVVSIETRSYMGKHRHKANSSNRAEDR